MPNDPQILATRFVRRLALFYAALFVSIGIQMPFFPLWLEAKDLDARMIGLVLAVPMVVRLFAIPVVTRLADRRQALWGAIVIASAAAAAGNLALGFSQGSIAILILFALASVPFTSIMPMAEAYALRGLADPAPMARCGGAPPPSAPAALALWIFDRSPCTSSVITGALLAATGGRRAGPAAADARADAGTVLPVSYQASSCAARPG